MVETRLGLPSSVHACLFDLDGVLTETATLHAQAWQRMFDDFLSARARSSGRPFVAFDVVRDYDLYVDGKPRDDGTRFTRFSRWDGLLADQGRYLDDFWVRADVELGGDSELQQAVRFALFHVLQAGSRSAVRLEGYLGDNGIIPELESREEPRARP
jgi:hypothetical protein